MTTRTLPVDLMHFQQLLRWCHEAYEESLERFGMQWSQIEPAGRAVWLATPGQPLDLCIADEKQHEFESAKEFFLFKIALL